MGGMLQRAIGGALKGAGDGMVADAEAARKAAIDALAEQNKRTDQQADFTHQDNMQSDREDFQSFQQADQDQFQGDQGNLNRDNALDINTANNANAVKVAGMQTEQQGKDAQLAANTSIATNKQTTGTELQVAQLRNEAYNQKTAAIAQRYSSGQPMTSNQALERATQAYKANVANGVVMNGADGNPVPAEQAISDIATKMMQMNPSQGPSTVISTGSGMTSNNPGIAPAPSMPNGGAAPNFSMPAASPTQSMVAPVNVPPAAAIAALKSNPKLSVQFDQKYGQGAAAGVMGH